MYGNVMNRIGENMIRGQPEPVEGMLVTEFMFTDREPGKIIRVEKKNGKVVAFWFRALEWHIEKAQGFGGYGKVHEDEMVGGETKVMQTRKGHWVIVSKYNSRGIIDGKDHVTKDGTKIGLGFAQAYRCPEI